MLHYRDNDRAMADGDLPADRRRMRIPRLRVDVTRTFPVGGRFAGAQRADPLSWCSGARYLDAPAGQRFHGTYHGRRARARPGLIDLGPLAGPLDQGLRVRELQTLQSHRAGHWLGMDVHTTPGIT